MQATTCRIFPSIRGQPFRRVRNIGEDRFHGLAHLRAVLGFRFGGLADLTMANHGVLPKFNPSSIRRSLLDARPGAIAHGNAREKIRKASELP